LKSGTLNLLELSGPLQACDGIASPYCFMLYAELIKEKIRSIHYCSGVYRVLKNSVVLIAIKSVGIAISNDRDYRGILT